jgi:hypothetical protein
MVGEYPEYPDTDEEIENQQEVYSDLAPSIVKKDDLWSLFKWVIARKDSSKVGNLGKDELGLLDIPVRECQRIALLGETLGHPGFAEFFRFTGEITLSTSVSKDGFMIDRFVTEKKQRTKESRVTPLPAPPQPKKGFFRR